MDIEIREDAPRAEKKVVAVQLPYEVYQSLLNEAENDFISVSDVMRRIIIRHYRKGQKQGSEPAKFIDAGGNE